MEKYTPELLLGLMVMFKNVVLIVACAWTTTKLYQMSGSWHCQFDNEKLVESCIKALQDAPPISRPRLQWRKADIAIGKAGVEATERKGATTVMLDETDIELLRSADRSSG